MSTTSTVSVAPDPGDEGTILVVDDPDAFPDPDVDGEFEVTVYADGEVPSLTNYEILRILTRNVNGWVFERGQHGTGPRTIIAGDRVRLTSDPVATYSVDVTKATTTAIVDFGADVAGRMVGVRVIPKSFDPDGETFGPMITDVNLFVLGFATSTDGEIWKTVAPDIVGYGNGTVHIHGLDDAVVWLMPTARYLRFSCRLETGVF